MDSSAGNVQAVDAESWPYVLCSLAHLKRRGIRDQMYSEHFYSNQAS